MAKEKSLNLNKEAVKGFSLALPFIIANFIAVKEIEPFYSFLHSFTSLHPAPILPLLLLLLFPYGAYISLKPVLGQKKVPKPQVF